MAMPRKAREPELKDEPRRQKVGGELERLRRADQEMHIQAAKRAGLSEAQAVAHAGEHMEERAREAYRGPGDHGHPGTKSEAHRRGEERVRSVDAEARKGQEAQEERGPRERRARQRS